MKKAGGDSEPKLGSHIKFPVSADSRKATIFKFWLKQPAQTWHAPSDLKNGKHALRTKRAKKIGPMPSETSAKDRRNVMVKLAVAKAYTATQLRWFGGGFVDSIYYVPKTAQTI